MLLPLLPIRYITKNFKRLYTSALFITDDKANKTFSVLTPHIDFTERIKEYDQLEKNIKLRESNVDLYDVVSVWKFYNKFRLQKNDLEVARKNIAKKLKNATDIEEIEKLKLHGRLIKEDLNVLKETYYEVEEKAILRVLGIPNVLHEKTPEKDEIVIHTVGERNGEVDKSHVEIGTSKNLLEMKSPSFYFLKNDFALYELSSTFFISDFLLDKNYVQFSNSDFVRSVIVEGCGGDYKDPGEVFTVSETDPQNFHENSRLHLVGGASLASFMAYYTKHTIFPSLLPLRYFTVGRKYKPVKENAFIKRNTNPSITPMDNSSPTSENSSPTSKNSSQTLFDSSQTSFDSSRTSFDSLLNVTQETAVELFIATKDSDDDMNSEFDNVLKDVIEIYESFNYHFQVCYIPAKNLKAHESLRASFQMYSPYLEKYIEVGHISVCDSYISKRLLFNYGRGLDMNFPRVISGTVVSIPKILACIIENNYELLNDKLRKYL